MKQTKKRLVATKPPVESRVSPEVIQSLVCLARFFREKHGEECVIHVSLVPLEFRSFLRDVKHMDDGFIAWQFFQALRKDDTDHHFWIMFRNHLATLYGVDDIDTVPEWVSLQEFSGLYEATAK